MRSDSSISFTDQFPQRLVCAMRSYSESSHADTGAICRLLDRKTFQFQHRKCHALLLGQSRHRVLETRIRTQFFVGGLLWNLVGQLFEARERPEMPRVIRRHVSGDREQPRLKWTCGVVGMTRLEKRHDSFLINVLDSIAVGDPPPQEVHE